MSYKENISIAFDLELLKVQSLYGKVNLLSQLDVQHDLHLSCRNGEFVGCQVQVAIDKGRDWDIQDFATLQEAHDWCDNKLMSFPKYAELQNA